MSEDEHQRAHSYSSAAIALLRRAGLPAYPRFYELFYTYATGTNADLNQRLNSVMADSVAITADMVEQLSAEFMKSEDVNARITSVSNAMSRKIEAVNSVLDSAMASANSYSGSLLAASGDLDREMDTTSVKALAKRLLSETQRMQDTNRKLELRLEESLGDIAGLQRDLEAVRRESMLDPLTKIYNRKFFDEGLEAAVQNARQTGEPLSLILLDVDHFKGFNDRFGHQTGDQVLRLVAATLKSRLRSDDLTARYGGEEFAAVLPGTSLDAAARLADQVRRAIQAKELLKRSTSERLGRVMASFGVACFRPEDTPASFLERADHCLYSAKHSGRNKVAAEDKFVLGDGGLDAA